MKARAFSSTLAVVIVACLLTGALVAGLWVSGLASQNVTAVSSTLSQATEIPTESNTSFPAPSHSSVTYAVITSDPNVPVGCMNVAGGQGEGYTLDIYLPTEFSVKPGDQICLETVVANVSNQTALLVPTTQRINITDSAGNLVFQTFCAITGPTAGNYSFSMGKTSACTAYWQANLAPNGSKVQPGTYHVYVSVLFSDSRGNTSSFALKDEADLVLVQVSGYTLTQICSYGYTTITDYFIVDSNGQTSTVGPAGPGQPPANDTTTYLGMCNISGP